MNLNVAISQMVGIGSGQAWAITGQANRECRPISTLPDFAFKHPKVTLFENLAAESHHE